MSLYSIVLVHGNFVCVVANDKEDEGKNRRHHHHSSTHSLTPTHSESSMTIDDVHASQIFGIYVDLVLHLCRNRSRDASSRPSFLPFFLSNKIVFNHDDVEAFVFFLNCVVMNENPKITTKGFLIPHSFVWNHSFSSFGDEMGIFF